jgi:hypothetical protein
MLEDLALLVNKYLNIDICNTPYGAYAALIWRINVAENCHKNDIGIYLGDLYDPKDEYVEIALTDNFIWAISGDPSVFYCEEDSPIKIKSTKEYKDKPTSQFEIEFMGIRVIDDKFRDRLINKFGI